MGSKRQDHYLSYVFSDRTYKCLAQNQCSKLMLKYVKSYVIFLGHYLEVQERRVSWN